VIVSVNYEGAIVTDGLKLVGFLQRYTEVMVLQLKAVQTDIDQSVGSVMQALQGLSSSTERRKQEADKVLETTYLNPDANTALMVENMQRSADEIFDLAQSAVAQGEPVDSPRSASMHDSSSDLRRMGGMFSKHMESLSTMDDSMKDLVMTMVGSLSNGDVIKQRLDHTVDMLRALNIGMGHVVSDLDTRMTRDVVARFREKLLDDAYGMYTVEQERDLFKRIFGPPPRLQRAYRGS
jgi:hypothetical protein